MNEISISLICMMEYPRSYHLFTYGKVHLNCLRGGFCIRYRDTSLRIKRHVRQKQNRGACIVFYKYNFSTYHFLRINK